ncbi:hypothetical protein F5B20DRAFT_592822 [Whalleya microplaca]|nr:hypothetical protein F5B20DRAFT_592822 [Whalleya microplaca]
MANGTYEKPIWPRPVKAESKVASILIRKFKELVRRDVWTKDDPNHPVDWTDDKVWEKIQNEGYYYRADEILISCGTVTIDEADSPRPKVLIVYNKVIGIYQLPKGRKDFSEGLLDAALRETTEETGVAVRPLRLRFGSRSTIPKLVQGNGREIKYGIEDKFTGITEGLSNESIGISAWYYVDNLIYPEFQVFYILFLGRFHPIKQDIDSHQIQIRLPVLGEITPGVAAQPRDSTKRDETRMTEETDRMKFSTFWVSENEAVSKLKLEDEKFMVQVTFAYLRDMSASDWVSNRMQEAEEDNKMNIAG